MEKIENIENIENEQLATEILHTLKVTSQRWFALFFIVLILFIASNMIWIFAWQKANPRHGINLNGKDYSNIVYNNHGEVEVNGETLAK